METKRTRTDKDVTMQCSMGHAFYKAGHYDKAINAFESALKIDPNSVDALSGKGNALRMNGKYDEALFFLEQSLKFNPDHVFSLARKGGVLMAKGQYEQALLFFDTALRHDPSHAFAWACKAEVLSLKKQYDEALIFFECALHFEPNHSFSLKRKGEILRERKDYDAAIICFDAVLTIEPNDSWALEQKYLALKDKGYALAFKWQNEEAIICFNMALKIKPADLTVLSYQAAVLIQKGENDNAIALCNQILTENDHHLLAWRFKGFALKNKGDYVQAISCFDTALSINPRDTATLSNKGRTLALQGQHDAAIQCCNAALAIDPQDTYALDTKGTVLKNSGDYSEAITCFERILKLNPNNADALSGKAEASRRLNQKNMEMDAINLNENADEAQTIEVSHAYLGVLEQLKKNQIEKLVFSNIQTVNQDSFVRKLPRRNNHSVFCITALPNGKVVMGGDANQSLRFLDPILDAYSESQDNHRAPICCLATFTNDQVISISTGNFLKLWNTDNLACLKAFQIPGSSVNCMTILSNHYVVTGSDDGDLNLLDVLGGVSLKILKLTSEITCLDILPSGKVVSVTPYGFLRIWDMEKGLCLKKLKVSTSIIKSLAVLPNGLVVCGLKDRIILCDVENNIQIYNLAAHKGFVNSLTVLPNGWVVSAGEDKALKVWDMASGVCLETLWGHTNPVGQMVVLPDGHIVSKGVNPVHTTLRLWNTKPKPLSGEEKSALLRAIVKNQSLQNLDLTAVSLGNAPDALTTLCALVKSHSSLTSLHLDLDTLNNDQVKELFVHILKHKKITDFSVGDTSFLKDGNVLSQSLVEGPLLIALKEALLAGLYAEGLAHAERGEYVEAVTWHERAKLMDLTYAWHWQHHTISTPFKASVDRYYDNTRFHLFTETRDVRTELMTLSSDDDRAVVKQLCACLKKVFKLKFLTKKDLASRNNFGEMTVPSDPESPEEKLIANLLTGWLTFPNKTFDDHQRVMACVVACYEQKWKGECWLILDQKDIDRIILLLTAGKELLITPDDQTAFLKQLEKIQNSISLNQKPVVGVIPRTTRNLGYCPALHEGIETLKAKVPSYLKEADKAVVPVPIQQSTPPMQVPAKQPKVIKQAVKSIPRPEQSISEVELSTPRATYHDGSASISPQIFQAHSPIALHKMTARVKAEKKFHKRKAHRDRIEMKSDWMSYLSHLGLGKVEKKQLKEFRCCLKSAISDLLLSVKVISAGDISANPHPLASFADAIGGASVGLIPYVGPYLKAVFGAGPFSALSIDNKKVQYSEVSRLFSTPEEITAFSVEFSGLITAYYYAEILNPSVNRTYMQRIYDYVSSGDGWVTFKRNADYLLEKYILGTDDKLPEKQEGYKVHWPDLINYVMSSLLLNIDRIAFADVDKSRVPAKLSAPFTPISSAPLEFNAKADGLDLINAYTLNRLSFLAYETERKIDQLAESWGYDKIKQLGESWDYEQMERMGEKCYGFIFQDDFQAFILADPEKICVVFRGTATFVNGLTDLHTWLSQGMEGSRDIKIHSGFMNSLAANWKAIKSFISCYNQKRGSQPRIWFTGHSLGGALATVATFRYFNEERETISVNHLHLYTYGQPKCGNQAFADYMDQHIQDYQRFKNYLDPFTDVPFDCMDYAHGGQLRWIYKDELLDQTAYAVHKRKKDCYGKEKTRENLVKCAQHLWDHSVYLEKIGKIAAKVGTKVYDFAEHMDYEFEISEPKMVDTNVSEGFVRVPLSELDSLNTELIVTKQEVVGAKQAATVAKQESIAAKNEATIAKKEAAVANIAAVAAQKQAQAANRKIHNLQGMIDTLSLKVANLEQHKGNHANPPLLQQVEAVTPIPDGHLLEEEMIDHKVGAEDRPANGLYLETEVAIPPVQYSSKRLAGGNIFLPVFSQPKYIENGKMNQFKTEIQSQRSERRKTS